MTNLEIKTTIDIYNNCSKHCLFDVANKIDDWDKEKWVSVEKLKNTDRDLSYGIAETIRKRFPSVSEKWLIQKAIDEYLSNLIKKNIGNNKVRG